MGAGIAPGTVEEAATTLRDAGRDSLRVRFAGGGTKLGWGPPSVADVVVSTGGLARILEHNAADLTAVLEAGVPLREAGDRFAAAGQMLAFDPPDPGGATIGGAVAAGDSGPLRHRYGASRDMILGVRVVLSDGTIARAGGRVIKNVAGYDLAKLFAGSFGTLGLIAEVVVRLYPMPPARATSVGRSSDEEALLRGALSVGRAPLELESFDIRWDGEDGALLARAAGVAPGDLVRVAARLMAEAGLTTDIHEADQDLWAEQRLRQRAEPGGAVVRVSAVRTELARVLRTARSVGATIVGRAGSGLFWTRLPAAGDQEIRGAIEGLRRAMAPRPCVVQDAPEPVRASIDLWGPVRTARLMRDVKMRFDPAGVCNPGAMAGGI